MLFPQTLHKLTEYIPASDILDRLICSVRQLPCFLIETLLFCEMFFPLNFQVIFGAGLPQILNLKVIDSFSKKFVVWRVFGEHFIEGAVSWENLSTLFEVFAVAIW